MHDDYDLRQEQLNKGSIMSSKKFLESLMEMFKSHVVRRTLVGLAVCCLIGTVELVYRGLSEDGMLFTTPPIRGYLCFEVSFVFEPIKMHYYI